MALDAATQALLDLIPAEDRTRLTADFEKYQVLRESVMRQDDYSRKLNEFNTFKARAEPILEWAENGDGKKAVEKANTNYRAFEEEKGKREALETQLQELTNKAASAANVNPDELVAGITAKLLASNGHLTADGLSKLITAEATKIANATADARQDEFFKKTLPSTAIWIEGMVDARLKHEKEFGKPINRAEFAEFMTKNGIGDPTEAYDRFTAPAKNQIVIEQAKKDAVAEYLRSNVPGTGVQPANGEMGALQRKIAASNGEQFGAAAAANALVEAGKF